MYSEEVTSMYFLQRNRMIAHRKIQTWINIMVSTSEVIKPRDDA